MPLKIQDFKEPTEHPFGMLDGYQRAFEKESVLMLILLANVKAGKFEPVKTRYTHPTMVEDGLLEEIGGGYFLTPKAIGLLYSVYHRGDHE